MLLGLSYLLCPWGIKSARWSQSACQPKKPLHLLTHSDGASGARVLFATSEFHSFIAQVEIQLYLLVHGVGWEVPRCPQHWRGNSCHALFQNATRLCFDLGQPKLPKGALYSVLSSPSWTALAFGNDWADQTSWPWKRWSCWWALDPSW